MKYDNYFFVVDVETGGLPDRLKKEATTEVALTELAIVIVDNVKLKIVESAHWYFKPYHSGLIYDPNAARVSGIDRQFCEKNGLDMDVAFVQILDLIKKYKRRNKKHYLVGHNIIKFDLDFLINLFKLNNDSLTNYFDNEVFDTLIFSRLKYVEASSFNLASSCQMANVTLTDAHKAINDTISTAELWISFLKCLRGCGDAVAVVNKIKYRESFKI